MLCESVRRANDIDALRSARALTPPKSALTLPKSALTPCFFVEDFASRRAYLPESQGRCALKYIFARKAYLKRFLSLSTRAAALSELAVHVNAYGVQ